MPATSGGSEAILKLRALHTNGDWDQTVTRLGPGIRPQSPYFIGS